MLGLVLSLRPVQPVPRLKALGISLPGSPATPTDIFTAMLKSRIMADDVIRQFNLMEHYETKTMQEARLELRRGHANRRQQRKGHQGHGRR